MLLVLPSLDVILFSFSVIQKQLWAARRGKKGLPNTKLEMVIDVEWRVKNYVTEILFGRAFAEALASAPTKALPIILYEEYLF